MADVQDPLSAAACFEYVHEKVFPLRPADYGIKYPKWPGLVGIEIEMLPLRLQGIQSAQPQAVPLFGPESVASLLFSLKDQHPDWRYQTVPEEPDHLLNVLLEDQDQISFEPGGQLEFSTRPYPCLLEATKRVKEIQQKIDTAAAAAGITITQTGMNPWLSVDTIGLQMTKPRYRAMDRFFGLQGPDGRRMMRQTCTIQVNLDFGGTEEVLAKRFLAANLVAPFATALFANSPYLDGREAGVLSARARTWQRMDPTRTGFPQLETIVRSLSRRACVDSYLDLALKGRVVFVEALQHKVLDQPFSFQQWLEHGVEGVRPTLKDFQTHLSLMFPEARARGFIELRSIDCQHRFWQDVPAAFYTGLLYDEQALNALLEVLLPIRGELRNYWALAPQGMQDNKLASIARRTMQIAQEGFQRLPSCFQGGDAGHLLNAYAGLFTERGLTPANTWLDAGRRRAEGVVWVEDWQRASEEWSTIVSNMR